MRSSILIALSAAFLFLLTTQASAIPSIDMLYLSGSTAASPEAGCGGDPGCVSANEGDVLTFAIVTTVESKGLVAYSFDLRWDVGLENEFDLAGYRQRGTIFFASPNPTPPPDTLLLGDYSPAAVLAPVESTGSTAGIIGKWEATSVAPSPPFVASVSFRVGVVQFEVNSPGQGGSPDMELGFYDPITNAYGVEPAGTFITPNFGTGRVIVPEPGTTMMIAASLSTLALLALRSRRDD